MSEKAQILHSNGNKDPVAIISPKIIVWAIIGLCGLTLANAASNILLSYRMGTVEDTVRGLSEKIENGMDSRWRRSDHEGYAQRVETRLRDLERKIDVPPDFPFTERKAEQLAETAYKLEDVLRRLSECEAKIKEHENGSKHEEK